MDIIFRLAILIFSVVVHEVVHGIVAEKFGDSTARDEGRITLNPLPHIDPFFSVLLPAILMAMQSPILFGAANPVPVNFSNVKRPKLGMAMVSLSGPLSNFVLAVLFALPVTFGLLEGTVARYWVMGSVMNIVLAVFNLLPIPPLDGSKVLASLLPDRAMYRLLSLERYGFFLVIIFLVLGVLDYILIPIVSIFLFVFKLPTSNIF